MDADGSRSPAARVMDEAIDLAIDADVPSAGHHIGRAADDGLSVVRVSGDGNVRILKPELGGRKDPRSWTQ